MGQPIVKLAVSLAILVVMFTVVQPAPVRATASVIEQKRGVCWDCSSVNSVLSGVANGDAIVVAVAGYAPCPGGTCSQNYYPGNPPYQVLGVSSLSVSDSINSFFTPVVAVAMRTTGAGYGTGGTMVLYLAVFVAIAPTAGVGDSLKVGLPYAAQELGIYVYDVRNILIVNGAPTGYSYGTTYDVAVYGVSFPQSFASPFLLGIVGTECPPQGNGYSISLFPGTGYTTSPYLYDGSPPPAGRCTSMHAEYSTTGGETPGSTTFPATIAGTTNPRWIEAGIVLTSHIQPLSTTSQASSSGSTAQTVSTDWAVVQVWTQPSQPVEATPVKLGMTLTVLSTTGAYPQKVGVQCMVDGFSCGSGSLDYPGPTGNAVTVTASTPWNAVAGTHTLSWQVEAINDPNPSNNAMSISFTVQPSTSQSASKTTTQSSSTSTTQSSTQQVTVVQMQTVTQQPTTATTLATSQPGVLDMIQQNSLLLIGALGLLVIVLAVAMMRRGKQGKM